MIHFADRVLQFFHGDTFEQISARAVFERVEHILVVVKCGQDNDLDVGILLLEDLRADHAVHFGHADIHQDHIRLLSLYAADHFLSVRSRICHMKIRNAVQNDQKALPYQFLVVSYQYFDHIYSPFLCRSTCC